ncbi:hypothetical protein QRD89_16050 [Halobacillus sp. ACCC02827]|uniref:hypothetical protein n=1 Tax=Halobacillus sp. ACCC02827 TaxID=3052090 RepID=UPI00256FC6B3|nr:hypothetical protein [Halobacillus sp. ACCC02827]WJE15215.1 hypothetical protein QRD89_16050 [Halobacillus sp. ACCC02827]
MKNPMKLIFAVFHVGTPLLYFIGYSVISYMRGNSVGASIPDTLSIIAIYLIVVNCMWLFSVDKFKRAVEVDEENQSRG